MNEMRKLIDAVERAQDDAPTKRTLRESAANTRVIDLADDQLMITRWLKEKTGLDKNAPLYFDDVDLVWGDDTIVSDALDNEQLTMGDLLDSVQAAVAKNPTGWGAEGNTPQGSIKKPAQEPAPSTPVIDLADDQLMITKWLKKSAGLSENAPLYFDDVDLVWGDDTIVSDALDNEQLTMGDLLDSVQAAVAKNPTGSWF